MGAGEAAEAGRPVQRRVQRRWQWRIFPRGTAVESYRARRQQPAGRPRLLFSLLPYGCAGS